MVPSCADVAITARSLIQAVDAAGGRVAGVGSADVLVVTIGGKTAHADGVGALIHEGARVAVITGGIGGCVHATGLLVARVRGAGIAIVTGQQAAALAGPVAAGIAGGASIAIGARGKIGLVQTAVSGYAAIVCAEIAVIAIHRDSVGAGAFYAPLADGAGIAV